MKLQVDGTSRMEVTISGSRIETHPRPMPSARAASQTVWTAMTAEYSIVSGMSEPPEFMALDRGAIGVDGELARSLIKAGELQTRIGGRSRSLLKA